ncbi:MAG: hypothetical protein II301_00375, partial [Peptococcaceae bacterium]|nr:hypothetical protein [Peptococcaceae bacterium]
ATLYPKSVDVIGSGSYHGEIIKFCSSLHAEGKLELETELMNWCAMRKEHGWRLYVHRFVASGRDFMNSV